MSPGAEQPGYSQDQGRRRANDGTYLSDNELLFLARPGLALRATVS
jgi:hypothetical protein